MNLNNRCLIIKVWLIEVTLYCLNTLLFYFEINTEMAVRLKALPGSFKLLTNQKFGKCRL